MVFSGLKRSNYDLRLTSWHALAVISDSLIAVQVAYLVFT